MTTNAVCMQCSSSVCDLLVQLIIVHSISGSAAAQILLHSICVITAALVRCMTAAQSLTHRRDGDERVIKPVRIWLCVAGDRWSDWHNRLQSCKCLC